MPALISSGSNLVDLMRLTHALNVSARGGGRVVRSRVVNPKWIAGARRHGYNGGGDGSYDRLWREPGAHREAIAALLLDAEEGA